MNPLDLLRTADETPRPLVVHAHPDDETLQTGPLLAWLTRRGIATTVITCTRGERGEIVAGSVVTKPAPAEFVAIRQTELAGALTELGIEEHCFLGTPPARHPGVPRREYRDSGMVWVSEGLAGPADANDPDSFTAAPIDEIVADLTAALTATKGTVIVGYDALGSYGHPDHVRVHELCVETARRTGVPLVQVASEEDAEGFEWFDLDEETPRVIAALRRHATQLTVGPEGITHVGGQHQDIPRRIGLMRG
ncbi:hypothetical protein HMPREF1531_00621 [Propionibacterium sp. oral taxon 192 str. F0372]|uniref:PIG-L family deacetylase n=1 Tax=Propionibacterium sp. oral taxon 192 TaxID=671222 RepID=UPI0003532823|nr:PIG-L family deacetylase [Propionibacterium sp. oral taxon 192]EPH05973.1 hypothetical protein HMPREF1531_00621 [Propionibacterium sp. oral taxon 192 str. F0372]